MGGRKSFVKATEARTGDTISGWNFDSNKYVIAGFSEKVLPRRAPPSAPPIDSCGAICATVRGVQPALTPFSPGAAQAKILPIRPTTPQNQRPEAILFGAKHGMRGVRSQDSAVKYTILYVKHTVLYYTAV